MDGDDTTLKFKVEKLEKQEILFWLEASGWVKSKAAKALGITERIIGYKIKKYGLEKEVEERAKQSRAARFNKTNRRTKGETR